MITRVGILVVGLPLLFETSSFEVWSNQHVVLIPLVCLSNAMMWTISTCHTNRATNRAPFYKISTTIAKSTMLVFVHSTLNQLLLVEPTGMQAPFIWPSSPLHSFFFSFYALCSSVIEVWNFYQNLFFAFGFRTKELDAYSVMVQGICRRRSISYNWNFSGLNYLSNYSINN